VLVIQHTTLAGGHGHFETWHERGSLGHLLLAQCTEKSVRAIRGVYLGHTENRRVVASMCLGICEVVTGQGCARVQGSHEKKFGYDIERHFKKEYFFFVALA
jgi:hypothetical protein